MAQGRTETGDGNLAEIRRLLTDAMFDEQRLYQRFSEASREADRWRKRAALAVSRSADDLARSALERSAEHEARASEFHLQYLDQKAHVEAMKTRLLDLEARSFRAPLRRLPVPGATRVAARPVPFSEERARLAAMAELERDEVAEKLSALEREERLERELAELKRKLSPES